MPWTAIQIDILWFSAFFCSSGLREAKVSDTCWVVASESADPPEPMVNWNRERQRARDVGFEESPIQPLWTTWSFTGTRFQKYQCVRLRSQLCFGQANVSRAQSTIETSMDDGIIELIVDHRRAMGRLGSLSVWNVCEVSACSSRKRSLERSVGTANFLQKCWKLDDRSIQQSKKSRQKRKSFQYVSMIPRQPHV